VLSDPVLLAAADDGRSYERAAVAAHPARTRRPCLGARQRPPQPGSPSPPCQCPEPFEPGPGGSAGPAHPTRIGGWPLRPGGGRPGGRPCQCGPCGGDCPAAPGPPGPGRPRLPRRRVAVRVGGLGLRRVLAGPRPCLR
jgi:hypothetical protein